MRFAAPLLLLSLLLTGGCKTLQLDSVPRPSWLGPKKVEYQRPARLAVIWSDALLNHPVAPTRGFGGRIYFYNKKNEAVPVDGELIVYAYDDTGGVSEGRQPDRKFVFKADQLTSYFSETQLGASYSIWVPWDRPGGGRKDVSLVPIFTSADGVRVTGQHTKVTLPGEPGDPGAVQEFPIQRATNPLHQAYQPGGPIRPVSHAEPTGPRGSATAPGSRVRGDQAGGYQTAGSEAGRGLRGESSGRTTTISLSPTTTRRLQESEPPERSLQKAMVTPRSATPATLPPGNAHHRAATGYFPPSAAPHPAGPPNPSAYGPSAYGSGTFGPGGVAPGAMRSGVTPAYGPVNSPASAPADRSATATARSRQLSTHSLPRKFQAPAGPIDRLDPDRFQR